jgi:beta-glucosidase
MNDHANDHMNDDLIDRLIHKLGPARKVCLLTGATTWRTAAEPDIGLREMVCSDGPAGARGESWDERRTSALLPSASALGVLWKRLSRPEVVFTFEQTRRVESR